MMNIQKRGRKGVTFQGSILSGMDLWEDELNLGKMKSLLLVLHYHHHHHYVLLWSP